MHDIPTHPFDAAAPTYDDDFTHTRLGSWLRDCVRRYVPFTAGQHVLELGCGTGEDALWMLQRGMKVTATDAAAQMLALTQHKAAAAGFSLNTALLDLNNPAADPPSPPYDAVFSNFGALNCVEDRQQLAAFLADRVKPGGKVVFVVMGPLCLWEISWHLLRLQPKAAFRRFREGQPVDVGEGQQVRVWYPSAEVLRREFSPYFRHVRTVGIGSVLPPPYLAPVVERWPHPFATLNTLEQRIGGFAPLAAISDHYLMILEHA